MYYLYPCSWVEGIELTLNGNETQQQPWKRLTGTDRMWWRKKKRKKKTEGRGLFLHRRPQKTKKKNKIK